MATRSRSRWLTALPVALALSLAAACTGDDSDEGHPGVITDPVETTTSTSTSSTSTSTTIDPDADAKAEVEAAYLAQWDAYVEILGDPNPSNPLIEQFYVGDSEQAMLDGITQMVLDGTGIRRPEDQADFHVNVLAAEVSGQSAVLTACVTDGLVVFSRGTGEVVNDRVVTTTFEAHLTQSNGSWQLSQHIVTDDKEGRVPCGD